MEKEGREELIQTVCDQIRDYLYSIEYKVVKKPKGIIVTFEVTKEQMDAIRKAADNN